MSWYREQQLGQAKEAALLVHVESSQSCNPDLEKGVRKQNSRRSSNCSGELIYCKTGPCCGLWDDSKGLFVCFYLKKKLCNMEWNLPMEMKGRMQVITRLEYK